MASGNSIPLCHIHFHSAYEMVHHSVSSVLCALSRVSRCSTEANDLSDGSMHEIAEQMLTSKHRYTTPKCLIYQVINSSITLRCNWSNIVTLKQTTGKQQQRFIHGVQKKVPHETTIFLNMKITTFEKNMNIIMCLRISFLWISNLPLKNYSKFTKACHQNTSDHFPS